MIEIPPITPLVIEHRLHHLVCPCSTSTCTTLPADVEAGKARCNAAFGVNLSISVTGDGFTFLDRLSYDPYNEREDLKAKAMVCPRRHGHYPEVICADQIYRTRANRAF